MSQIKQLIANPNHAREKDSKRPKVLTALLESNLPPQELSPLRLQQEGSTLIGAGMETTKWTLSVGSTHIMSNPEVLAKLKAELVAAIPNPDQMPSLEQLEKLPYLDACIQEGK